MLRIDRTWKPSKILSLYSGLAVGVKKQREFENEKELYKRVTPAYQVYVAGVEARLFKRLYIDANLGYGVAGIFNMGGRMNF